MATADPSSGSAGVPARRILSHLYEVGRLIQKLDEQEDLLARILDGALQILGAQRGMILLRDEAGEIVPAVVRELEEEVVADASDYSHTAVREAQVERLKQLRASRDPACCRQPRRARSSARSRIWAG